MSAEIGERNHAVWDLDGTILDSYSIFSGIVNDMAPGLGLAMPTAEVMATNFHGSLRDSIAGCYGIDPKDWQLERIEKEFLERQEGYYDTPAEHVFSDAVELHRRLRAANVPQHLVTNRNHEGRGKASPRHLMYAIEAFRGGMRTITCGDETEYRKPDARVVDKISGSRRVWPEHLVIVGDQHVDAQLAANLGARAIIVQREGMPPLDLTQFNVQDRERISVVQSLDEVVVAI